MFYNMNYTGENDMSEENRNQTKFINKLKEMFRYEGADLNFGIYKVMNQKRKVINDFLSTDLPQKINDGLSPLSINPHQDLIDKISGQIETLNDINVSNKYTSEIQEKKNELDKLQSINNVEAGESEIYSHLLEFFSRYYDDGDFISQRRFKDGVYAIPYEGEEVKLHWANSDQFYIKSSENFSNYEFQTEYGNVVYQVLDIDYETDNNKEEQKEFRFLIDDEIQNPQIIEGKLTIFFEYVDVEKSNQKNANLKTIELVNKVVRSDIRFQKFLPIFEITSGSSFSKFENELKNYTTKNTFDYFIHKDLGAFLKRELDLFIKNEILFLENLQEVNAIKYLTKAKVIKEIATKIIDFLAQIENFQKKLWLKKKFVIQTDYYITLDKIPEDFFEEILNNEAQIEAWVKLFSINEIEKKDGNLLEDETAPFTRPLKMDFLKQNLNLVLDTAHFSVDFKERLVETFDNLDDQLLGTMINSDNSQALNLIRDKYRGKVQTTYIDPPYNTEHSEILYKNNFKHSSWLSLLNNTISNISDFWSENFSFGLAIDDYEYTNLQALLKSQFPNLENSTVIVNHHPQGSGGRLSRTHEYYILLSDTKSPAYLGFPTEDKVEKRAFMRSGRGVNNFRKWRWNSFYALLIDEETNEIVGTEPPVPLGEPYPLENTTEGYKRTYPINSRGEERVWRSSYITGTSRVKKGELIASESGTIYQVIDHKDKRETLFSNWTDSKFNAGTQGANLLFDMGLGEDFDYPKSIKTIETGLWAQSFGQMDSLILDYFAGSGTTGHAVINLNREDKGNRKFILVEMGEYFNTATLPRIAKAIYSRDWKSGKPDNRATGYSAIIKYFKLESYEDALNNVTFNNEQVALDVFGENFAEDYKLNYMLEAESMNSDTFLNIEKLSEPFDYVMNIMNKREIYTKKIDIIETFNFLIGLNISKNYAMRSFDYEITRTLLGKIEVTLTSGETTKIKVIEGTLPNGKKSIVIWRSLSNDLIIDNAILSEFFTKSEININEYHSIFVNGDTFIEETNSMKVYQIEQIMKKEMFKTEAL